MLKLFHASRSGAGAYQQQRFEDGRRSWRRRVLPPVRLVLLLFAAPSIVYEFWAPSPPHFLAGFLLGGLAACYLWAREDVPSHLQRHADGAAGERATAKALRALLNEGWHVAHDVDTGRGNRDHVLVGPGGVFLLDSKQLAGAITIDGDTVCVERRDDPAASYKLDKLAGHTRSEAARLHDEILKGDPDLDMGDSDSRVVVALRCRSGQRPQDRLSPRRPARQVASRLRPPARR